MLQGVKSGADAVEIDIRSTRDGSVILMHDEHIPTRSGRRILLETLTLADMLELEKSGEILYDLPELRITRLEDALAAAATLGSILNLDLKDDRSIPVLCKAVKRYDLVERTVVTGCDVARAGKVKEECPDLQVLLNITRSQVRRDVERTDAVKMMCRQAVSGCCCGINIDYRLCSEQLVDYARLRYLPVSVWTVDRPEDMESMIAMGVFSITTYEPARLKRLLATPHSEARN
jgi:glycerophosphoryl diester phosphodiesterase